MRLMDRHLLWGLLVLTACVDTTLPTDEPPPVEEGTVRVVTRTEGIGTDPTGYLVVAGNDTTPTQVADTVYLTGPAGTTLTLGLRGIDGACRIHDNIWRYAKVAANDTVDVAYQVDCGIITVYTGHPTLGPAFVDIEVVTGRATGHTTHGLYPDAWDFSPDGKRIAASAFVRGDGSWSDSKIYLYGPGASDTVVIATGAGLNQYPAWSPDGEEIRFVSGTGSTGFQLLSAQPDGSGATPVPGFPDHPVSLRWSRQGDRVAYVTAAQTELVVAHADGSLPQTVATGPYSWVATPDWSPSGDSLVYAAVVVVDTTVTVPLFIVRTDGSPPTQLTHPEQLWSDYSPSWSKDGRYIAYLRSHQANGAPLETHLILLDLSDGSTREFPYPYPMFSLHWHP